MQSPVGDFVGVKGGVKRTDKGELSVLVAEALPAEAWRKGRASSLHTACCEQVHSRLSELVARGGVHGVSSHRQAVHRRLITPLVPQPSP